GPVICILASNPYTTGCLECFELRALARLEDHVQYHNFVNEEKRYFGNGRSNPGIKPLLNMLVNQTLSEAFLIRKIGVSKFTGRLLTTYLPTMEIQAQDILRVPFCPACGAVAKARLEEKNISSRALVDEMVANTLSGK
ncbi:MAG TPA: streptolysin associated protein SagC, partial [Firmicutes bacterium]|nr:streptolysin associated protein SagC [Bacillota bacterium]